MSIKVGQAFERTSANPIDESIALTKAKMLTVNDNLMPAYYFTICQDDGKLYLYDKTATPDPATGKFKKFDGGSGGGAEIYDTTDTLNSEINGTKVVLAADLPGVSFSDLVVGSSIIKDAKGTLGIVTTITGTTSVTVTTATTSTPTMELTQAQYDALTPAQQNNGTIYFITDNQPNGGTYVGAYETIYSTTEHVVGSYMGKPLYQKTYYKASLSNNVWNMNVGTISSLDELVELKGVVKDSTVNLYYELNSTYPSDTLVMGLVTSDGRIDVYCARQNDTWVDCYVTVRYTKTTDTTSPVEYASPNDYSTSEKIVGTWVDGKPIYQKVYSIYMTSDTYTAPFLPEVDDIISINFMSRDSRNSYSHPYYSGTNDYSRVYVENGNLLVKLGSAYPTKPATVNIIIQYTKTTD